MIHATKALNADENIGCLIVTGSEKAFAAGADISEMANKDFASCYKEVSADVCWEQETFIFWLS